ncbi:hypothetical protein DH2020_035021 [Rehmannia glutinosa]|uniref:Inositol-pentakisphosphate 2-kinase n=1 Tax=Rehmannia glutinosa TaxID=99300 RepID=A0ABR0V7R6_REHGL
MAAVLQAKDAAEWAYRGEGAVNLVLAYCGSSPNFVGKVLRIQKVPNNGSKSENGHSALTKHECLLWGEFEGIVSAPTREIAEQLYVKNIRVLVSKEFLEAVEDKVLRQRPSWRVDAAKISQISKYDPLDLFSGSKDRVQKAIKSMFLTPQNNFRVFLNGSLIFGGMDGAVDSPSCMDNQALQNGLKRVIVANDGMHTKYFMELVAETVLKSGLLNQLLEVQKLDAFDIEGAIHAYYDIVSQPCMVCQTKGRNKLSGRYSSIHSMPRDEKLKVVRDYLISATGKDLSMMISFRSRGNKDPESPYNVVFLESTNQTFDYKVNTLSILLHISD